ncbi:hypothetical protein SLEP1_g21826 [Rubroshorea leprosula]|uniref:Auxin-responsive protein n=1 Tax=Rubroshorea leprosula TaxID=152421 RepID=A0AAV5JDC2_9ROSI|nr:hypothetical protein SLEP1_g21826 [Rubroshorea leprosula]
MSLSSSTSIDSSSKHQPPPPPPSLSSSAASSSSSASHRECPTRRDLSTDLRLGLSISPSHNDLSSTLTQWEQKLDWPPIKPQLWSTLASKSESRRRASLFVKVYMEGIPIGRKLDLFAHDDYNALISTLGDMFKATILRPGEAVHYHSEKNHHHVLTYEDKEGDWMMVGDVPWEMFLNTVKRLKITRADRC